MTCVDSHWPAPSALTQRQVGRSPCTISQSSLTLTLGVNSQHRHTSIDIGYTTSEGPGGVGPYLKVDLAREPLASADCTAIGRSCSLRPGASSLREVQRVPSGRVFPGRRGG
jgi:hypothetical protein